jgi:DEAD/DEAH box helicase domain-containing protein
VDELDLTQHIAYLRSTEADYYTEPRKESQVSLVETLGQADVKGAVKGYGELSIVSQVVGYHKIEWFTHQRLGTGEVDLPQSEFQTMGYWLALNKEMVEKLSQQGLWNYSANRYGPTWRKQKQAARERDGFTCQNCGAVEDDRAHDVHHITPFRAYETAEDANRLENLTTLCPTCHRRAETFVRMRSGLSGLAFTLGHLAPLFLMCAPHDLGIHADPQSNLADGQPVVVIYDLVPAGIGFSERLFELHDEIMLRAYELVSACECQEGCPSCVGPGGERGAGGKRETLAILKMLTADGE